MRIVPPSWARFIKPDARCKHCFYGMNIPDHLL